MDNVTSHPFVTASVLQSHNSRGSTIVPAAVAFVLALGLLLVYNKGDFRRIHETEEPPVLCSKIPLVGHLIGMLRWQVGYMQMLSSKCPSWPAFTLKIFSSRIYVICDPFLIQAAYRNAKAFDFGSFVVESSERLFDISEQGMKIVRGETAPGYDPHGPLLNGNNGYSFLNEDHRLMAEALSPGPALLDLNKAVLDRVAGSLNDINTTKHNIGLDFEADMTLLMLQFLPTLIAPKAYRARQRIKAAFANYYENGYEKCASVLIRSHHAGCKKWGFTDDDIANFEVSTLFLATTNTVSTSFWQLSYILSDPDLLREIRTEVLSVVKRTTRDGMECATVDTTLFQSHCPLLVSSFHETLRLVGAATSIRAVVTPTVLSSPSSSTTYSLQSPAVIQLPSGVTHTSPAIWGPDANTFNPGRFLPKTKASLDKETRRKQNQGYFPFGGGKHLCPGRHFAKTEVLAFIAAIVTGFEVEGSCVPERAFQKLGTGVRKPVCDVDVGIVRKEGWENVKWVFSLGGNGGGEVDFKTLVGDSDEE
ncbi:hypothetical protein G7Y89_g5778 [Cudoniella acicularis]|uniref:Cytochrome P450 n=1 Tax=Cudoniella acicularis TaxID=354080 RepID=A0A8H4RLV5_9HELO|nr:hypothetical protein G7Y89_g5778 [Cudoniella acicularis]